MSHRQRTAILPIRPRNRNDDGAPMSKEVDARRRPLAIAHRRAMEISHMTTANSVTRGWNFPQTVPFSVLLPVLGFRTC